MTLRSPSANTTMFFPCLLILVFCLEGQCQADEVVPRVSSETMTIHLPNLPESARPMRFICIPAGSFLMGSTDTERDRESDETPIHTVTFANDFFMGETEVTQAQWLALMRSLPGPIPGEDGGEGNNFPVYNVCWNDCQEFIGALNLLGQGSFRLPSEAEWEYGCRAGSETAFFFGDSIECEYSCEDCAAGDLPGTRGDYMWYCGNSNRRAPSKGPAETATLLPNPFGLYDISGSLFEWCEDWFQPSYVNAPDDGRAWVSPKKYGRVIRGGHYASVSKHCRSADRGGVFPAERNEAFGFRVVREP